MVTENLKSYLHTQQRKEEASKIVISELGAGTHNQIWHTSNFLFQKKVQKLIEELKAKDKDTKTQV